MVTVTHMTKCAATPIYGKKLSSIGRSMTLVFGMYNLGCGPIKFDQMTILGLH